MQHAMVHPPHRAQRAQRARPAPRSAPRPAAQALPGLAGGAAGPAALLPLLHCIHRWVGGPVGSLPRLRTFCPGCGAAAERSSGLDSVRPDCSCSKWGFPQVRAAAPLLSSRPACRVGQRSGTASDTAFGTAPCWYCSDRGGAGAPRGRDVLGAQRRAGGGGQPGAGGRPLFSGHGQLYPSFLLRMRRAAPAPAAHHCGALGAVGEPVALSRRAGPDCLPGGSAEGAQWAEPGFAPWGRAEPQRATCYWDLPPPARLPARTSRAPQVYRGRLRSSGEEVAVKVQRPGIGDSIALDMVLLRRLMAALDAAIPQVGDLRAEGLFLFEAFEGGVVVPPVCSGWWLCGAAAVRQHWTPQIYRRWAVLGCPYMSAPCVHVCGFVCHGGHLPGGHSAPQPGTPGGLRPSASRWAVVVWGAFPSPSQYASQPCR